MSTDPTPAALREGDANDGRQTAFYSVHKPTLWERLGFRECYAPRPPEMEEAPGWSESWFIVVTRVHLDWKDRLRLLISGNLMIDHAIKTDVPIARSQATSAISVLPPRSVKIG